MRPFTPEPVDGSYPKFAYGKKQKQQKYNKRYELQPEADFLKRLCINGLNISII